MLVVVGLLVIGAITLALVGRIGSDQACLPDVDQDLRPDTEFDVVLRGYRMDEVDSRIAELEGQIALLKAQPRPIDEISRPAE